jgi:hypothetical protein
LNVKPSFTTPSGAPPAWSSGVAGVTQDGTNGSAWLCVGPRQIELAVTAGLAIDRVGRLIDVPRTVCILLNDWLAQQMAAWANQVANPWPGGPVVSDPNLAIHDGKDLMCDVFATFVPCTQGITPSFASKDDYDATDAFSANRYLDSFVLQVVLRTDPTPLTPADPWKGFGKLPAGGSALTAAAQATIQGDVLNATAAQATGIEYPPNFDGSSVFLARILIAAKAGASGQPPTFNLAAPIAIDNSSRLYVYPAGLQARLLGLGAGTET